MKIISTEKLLEDMEEIKEILADVKLSDIEKIISIDKLVSAGEGNKFKVIAKNWNTPHYDNISEAREFFNRQRCRCSLVNVSEEGNAIIEKK